MLKNKFGITLIALVITIVVLVILAGVGINLSMGENGILGKAQNAVDKYRQASQNEQIELAKYENEIDGNRGNVTLTQEEYAQFRELLTIFGENSTFHLSDTTVLNVEKPNSERTSVNASTCWFSDSAITQNYDNNYFEYNASYGFIVKKAGWYLIEMYGHSSANGNSSLVFKINNREHKLNGTFAGNTIGQTSGNMTVFLQKNDIINGYFSTDQAGTWYGFNCLIYPFILE